MKQLNKKRKFDFCFRHWSNKPYAAFNSMKKVFKMGVICVTYTMITTSYNNAFAVADTTKTEMLNEAIITAEKRRSLSEIGKIITVIERDDIANMPSNSLNDLLKTIPGIDIRSRGQDGVQANISIRGGTFEQTLILLNGINITDPQTGLYNSDIPINIEDIDRIEILEGAGALSAGPGAFSGAINIITGEKKSNELNFKIESGSHTYLSQSSSGNFHSQNININASAKHSEYAGHSEATDYLINNFFVQTNLRHKTGLWRAQASWQNKAFGANSFYSPAYKNQFDHTRTGFSSINWSIKTKKTELSAAAYWRKHYDRYELIRDSAYGRNFHRTDAPGAFFKINILNHIGLTSAGGGIRSEKIISTGLGNDLESKISVDFPGDIYPVPEYSKGTERNSIYTFASQSFSFNKLSFSGGIQNTWYTDYGFKICGGLNAEYRFNNKYKLTGGVNSAMRLPSFTEMFYKGAGYAPPVNILDPEKSVTYEIGLQNISGTNLSIYKRYGKSILDWTKPVENEPWTSSNITKVNVLGIQAHTELKFTGFIKNLKLSGLWQTQSTTADNFISKYTQDYLKLKLAAEIRHSILLKKITADWRLLLQDRNGSYQDYETEKSTSYPTLFLIDVKIKYTHKSFAVYALSENMLNTVYMDIANVKQPGFRIKTGISVLIK